MSVLKTFSAYLGFLAHGMSLILEAMGRGLVPPVPVSKFFRKKHRKAKFVPDFDKDYEALASDWKKLCRDMRKAEEQYVNGK